ncbi:carbohydrate sulfotransferase 15-like [Mya arenaria]|uniref:carbohydrate sulfotransferase 15-like n=1 Tax=Mya arenaria TaxID=6604 RepID=UPI0022DEA0EC|nr:carbohydrate sulfotransferase 15-like [Mya arenaria]
MTAAGDSVKNFSLSRKFKNPCWYNEEGSLNCLPYMYLVGIPKCGTTDLFGKIIAHPDFVRPIAKEPGWLSDKRFWPRYMKFGFQGFSQFFSPIAKALRTATEDQAHNWITGDFSINTLEGSHFWQYLGNNKGKMEPIENNPQYIYHMFHGTRIILSMHLRRGLYSVFLADYLSVFPRDQILVHRLEDMSDDREHVLNTTHVFLGLRPMSKADLELVSRGEHSNRRRQADVSIGDMWLSTRTLLYQFYKPFNEMLANLLKDSRFDYGLY